jgi:hypothetical protein
MENFFNYISKPVTEEELTLWIESNNIIFERLEVYQDFVISLVLLIIDTYLGDESVDPETKIRLNDDDKKNHFDWCWNKVINNFLKENIIIESEGEHKVFLMDFIFDLFYNQKNDLIKESIIKFFNDVFKMSNTITKSDLDLITTIYKGFNRNTKFRFT